MRLPLLALSLLALLLLLTAPARAEELPVDLELVLAVDASGSVDDAEFALQMRGIAAAFRSPAVLAAIGQGPLGRIAVTVTVWAEGNYPKDVLPWHLILDQASGEAFAAAVQDHPRRPIGGTGIGKGLQFSAQQFTANGFQSARQVIDLSGDGRETPARGWSLNVAQGRAFAAARGIAINALAITTDDPGLAGYFRAEVILGPHAFVETAASYEDFTAAIERKLLREILQLTPTSEGRPAHLTPATAACAFGPS